MKLQSPASRRHAQGFTLIELLIALLLVGIILTAVVYVNIETVRASAALQARNELLPELQVTQNYMAGKLKEAAYIFPNLSNIQMSVSGATTAKPPGGSAGSVYNWVIGTDPIIAFVMPPKTVIPNGCATATAAKTATINNTSTYCYAFYAFYAIKRDAFVAATSGADDPGANGANDASSWVLVEYRAYYDSAGYLPSTAFIPTGNTGQLLMDFLPAQYSGATKLFTTNAASAAANQLAGSTTVTINLAALKNVAGQMVRLPSGASTDFNTLVVYPRNVGQPTLLSN